MFGDKKIYEIPKKKIKVMKTIEAFTKYFPDFSEYQILNKNNPFEIINELSINKKISNYLEIIRENLIKKEIIENKNNTDLYLEKIKNYIMDKIYEKIYPTEPCDEDKKLCQKAQDLSWVKLKDFLGNKNKFDEIDDLFYDIIKDFVKISITKLPNKKSDLLKEYI